MSITEYNGAALVAMKGKNCVAIASDTRLGVRAQTVSCDFKKIFKMGDHLMVGLPGLATDVLTVAQKLEFRINLYKLREEREIRPVTCLNMLSSMLYEHRFGPFFVEPMIAGLDSDGTPFIATTDLIGCPNMPEDFVVGGTCSEQLYGICESLFKPDLEPDDLFEVIAQSLLNAQDRDALSGWGGVVHIIEKDKITTRRLKARMD
eukprot:m.332686 g.332686  ORF g.332686 m.332686 type:complete len:205 (-) comp16989_c0_seq1:187-801(-)